MVEDPALVVRPVRLLRRQDHVSALVADEILVERRNQQHSPAPISPHAGVPMDIEHTLLPANIRTLETGGHEFLPERDHLATGTTLQTEGNQFVSEDGQGAAAVVDVQAGPPDEVFEGGGAVAAVIFAREQGERFVTLQEQRTLHLFGDQRERPLGGMKVAGAQEAGQFREPQMIGQMLFVHVDVALPQRLREFLLQHAPLPGGDLREDAADARLFLCGDVHSVRVHPPAEPGPRLVPAQIQHPPQILPRNQLPRSPKQMRSYDLPRIERLLEGLVRRLLRPHRHGPSHRLVLLRLHRPEPRHHLRRFLELRTRQLLAQQSHRHGIHLENLSSTKIRILFEIPGRARNDGGSCCGTAKRTIPGVFVLSHVLRHG